MPLRESAQDGLPYRSPVSRATNPTPITKDEDQYSTLKTVFGILEDASVDLYKDFNAFNIDKTDMPEDRKAKLLHEIEIKQGVYDIIAPLVERVGNAMAEADSNFRRRQQK